MEEDTPQTIALEMLRLITSMQKSLLIHHPKQEYDFLISISGIPICLTLTMECSTPYLIELSQESNHPTSTELSEPLRPLSNMDRNNVVQISKYIKSKEGK